MTKLDTGTDELLGRIEDRVAVLTLNRPQARNALSDNLTPALRRMIVDVGEMADVGALLVTGADGAFCAGGDVKGMGANKKTNLSFDETVADLQARQRGLTGALMALRIPTIAALPGPAAGAGLSIALACDIRIAAKSAFVSTAYARIALTGDYGMSWLLTRAVGNARARQLMFTAEKIDADRCERLGLVNQVVPDDQLQTVALDLARRLASGPKQALGFIKDHLDRAVTDDFLTCMDHEAELMVRSFQTEEHREAVQAFVEKRLPRFAS